MINLLRCVLYCLPIVAPTKEALYAQVKLDALLEGRSSAQKDSLLDYALHLMGGQDTVLMLLYGQMPPAAKDSIYKKISTYEKVGAIKAPNSSLVAKTPLQIDSLVRAKEETGADAGLTTIAWETEFHEMGQVVQGDTLSYDFVFTNTGKAPLIMHEYKAACDCTVPVLPAQPVLPGERGKVTLRYDTSNKQGRVSAAVVLYNNTPDRRSILRIVCDVQPKKR
jgi:hypothetical protein